jgi:hypothetical protein
VATPLSAIPAALASPATNKNGTPTEIGFSCAFANEIMNRQTKSNSVFFIGLKN